MVTPLEIGVTQTSPAAPDDADDAAQIGPLRIGQTIGANYEILSVLGAGGMGVVYDAFDHALRRRVAIKVAALPTLGAALRAEAQALAALRSPFFVQVYAAGEHGSCGYMVMERLVGETLETHIAEVRLRGGTIPVPEVLDLLVPVAEALATAQRAGLSQRDLKPSNVFLAGDRVVLLDMGIAVPEALVKLGAVAAGSIEYIAPEVLLGTVDKGAGPLVDLYALGTLAFELLTLTTPFRGGRAREVMMQRLLDPAPDARLFRPDVPDALAALIAELLAKEPAGRPPGAEAVLWQLEEIRHRGERRSVGPLKVLAIDDEAHVGTALKRSLESAFPRIQVEVLTDPKVAISRGAADVDIVLVDMHMPQHNGLEVCMHFLALPHAHRPDVVAMSAGAKESDIEVLRSLGVRDFVRKDDSFLTSMNHIIGRFRASLAPPPSRPPRSNP